MYFSMNNNFFTQKEKKYEIRKIFRKKGIGEKMFHIKVIRFQEMHQTYLLKLAFRAPSYLHSRSNKYHRLMHLLKPFYMKLLYEIFFSLTPCFRDIFSVPYFFLTPYIISYNILS